ncbi:hypothetical protein CERZMDRAFT_86189 [Cercospora zeae-maydis SCOH1-5]|uniref:Uncharacterized protein n=1 Tax=Cercospora zeae-maydis SCOH1-5 TaxID=717836 RepID=A0A6A6FAV9_9PEZI|nr:hypothetical protein CERZMDRAFT_86189 [Cercospora zeae-maydis SCOH1-5]
MKSTFFALTALATVAAAAMDGVMVFSVGKRDALYQPIMDGMRLRRDGIPCPDQNYCDTNVSCGAGEQAICDATAQVCTCKITNGAAACAASGAQAVTWYTDSRGDVCCARPCDPSQGKANCHEANQIQNEKPDCN